MNFMRFSRFAPNAPFVDQLAGWLLSQAGDPLAFASTLVLLPTRRACRSLHEAFLRESDGKPLLLPRILPIGEVDSETDILALFASGETLPPAMPDKRRLAILTRLIMQGEKTTHARAYQLALELARLLDEVTRAGIGFDRLESLAPLELAAHWQKTVQFLGLITTAWPRIAREEGKEDATRLARTRMLMLAEHWQASPPDFPVIAAGSTGSIPATAALLKTIAGMPNGHVILPGLDKEMPDEAWDLLEPTHPQYGLRQFLRSAEIARADVADITPPHSNDTLRTLFAPAPLTAHWSSAGISLAGDLAHVRLAEAATQLDEARMIAYLLRETLETPGKTAALVTPDRTLARMVAAECARYTITIDDSAGQKLSDSAPAIFMQLLLEAAASGFAPHNLLALLRHPFAAMGEDTATCRAHSRTLELQFLRGVRLESGMDALIAEMKRQAMPAHFTAFFTRLRDCLRPLELAFTGKAHFSLQELIALHVAAAEGLATSKDTAGANILWSKEAGKALSDLLAGWANEASALGDMAAQEYPALFDGFVSGATVRHAFGQHPRLHILSPIEMRLMHYDLVVLGEMNEGVWPASQALDPWMSAPMREAFGLPAHAVQVGQSAHDLWMLLHAKEVVMTRARKIFGAPQEASRWWVRLITLVKGKDEALLARMDISRALEATLATQDAPYDIPPATRPQPTPPLGARPLRYSPSSIDLLQHEPYAFYARYVLKLPVLDALDQEPDAAEFGRRIHNALELFSAEYPDRLPEHAYQLLIAKGEVIFAEYASRPSVIALWWPRFEAIARNWLARESLLRREPYHSRSEVEAKWTFPVGAQEITFTARADRVDETAQGFRLIDYKTGTPPGAKKVESGEAKQLPLTALALMRSGVLRANPTALIYWALKTREQSKDFVEVEAAEALLAASESELMTMIVENLQEGSAYAAETVKQLPESRDEYDHLIRRSEWGNG